MIDKILYLLDKIFPSQPVFAHCDIPCGIYDPKPAQMFKEAEERKQK